MDYIVPHFIDTASKEVSYIKTNQARQQGTLYPNNGYFPAKMTLLIVIILCILII